MVREEPVDRGDEEPGEPVEPEEPVNVVAQYLEMERMMRDGLIDFEPQEEDLSDDEDTEEEGNDEEEEEEEEEMEHENAEVQNAVGLVNDSGDEDMVGEEVVDEPVPMDAEDAVPLVDEAAMNEMYQKVIDDAAAAAAANNNENRAPSIASNHSNETEAEPQGINEAMAQAPGLWDIPTEATYASRHEHLWPHVRSAIIQLRDSGRLNHDNLLDNTPLPQQFLNEFDEALEVLLRKPQPPITDENKTERVKYEEERVKMLQKKSIQFHKNNNNRPAWFHEYGSLFPVQATYDMVEYLDYVWTLEGFNFKDALADNTVWQPELSEVHPDGRRYMESHFIMDSSVRQEFIDLVKSIRRETGSPLTTQEIKVVTKLFDTMNSIFNLNFEYYIIDNADLVKRQRELRRHRNNDENRFNALNAAAVEDYRVLQDMMNGRAAAAPAAAAPEAEDPEVEVVYEVRSPPSIHALARAP